MLKSILHVDLPSVETLRPLTPFEWVRSLFGAQLDLRSGKEALTVCAFSLIEGLVAGFARAGIQDVLSFLVDKRVVYMDSNEVPDDLPLIAHAAQAAGILDHSFREMHLVLAHRDELLHTLIDCKVTSEVVLGEAEMRVVLSSRIAHLQIQRGETAEQYAERVRAFAAQPDSFDPARLRLDDLSQRIASALQPALVGSKVAHEPAVVQLIRPGRQQIGRFAALPFGDEVQSPEYRPLPTQQRAGAYADPFYYYYHDPYYDYFNYVLIQSMFQQSVLQQSVLQQSQLAGWHSQHVQVVDPTGTPLFNGEQAPLHAHDTWIGHDAVSYTPAGEIELSAAASEPDDDRQRNWMAGSAGGVAAGSNCGSFSSSDDSASWSGSDQGDSGTSCNSVSSGDSGSSCGSSCSSGSSCGSSCGGGGSD
jgi:hypothetical protein